MKAEYLFALSAVQLVLSVRETLSRPVTSVNHQDGPLAIEGYTNPHLLKSDVAASYHGDAAAAQSGDVAMVLQKRASPEQSSSRSKHGSVKEKKTKKDKSLPVNMSEYEAAMAKEHMKNMGKSLAYSLVGPFKIMGQGAIQGVVHGVKAAPTLGKGNVKGTAVHLAAAPATVLGGIAMSPAPLLLGPVNAANEARLAMKARKEAKKLKGVDTFAGLTNEEREAKVWSMQNRLGLYQDFHDVMKDTGMSGKHTDILDKTGTYIAKKKYHAKHPKLPGGSDHFAFRPSVDASTIAWGGDYGGGGRGPSHGQGTSLSTSAVSNVGGMFSNFG
ncbi:hypothetical protein CBS101457_004863 [Exobasidium rhododendri]|nr:hypothetical protein CBS101457_004863 [Exobasidium rhododendri]